MKTKEKEEIKHISVFSIAVENSETGCWQYVWEKYIKGQYSIAGNVIDKDMETEMARLMNLGFKIIKSRTGVSSCLSERSYDKSIVDKLKHEEYFIESFIT